MKYWEILLIKQRERGKDGLTLPFLIGSQDYLDKTHTRQTIEKLILDIASNDSFETCIRHCMGTQTLIFEIRKPLNAVYYPTYKDIEQRNISISKTSIEDLSGSIEILIERLTDRFQDLIKEGLYSAQPDVYARNAKWSVFSKEDDIPFIVNSFQSLEKTSR